MGRAIATVAGACLVAMLAAGCGERSDAEIIASARQHLDKHAYASAIIEAKAALQKTPTSTEARLLLAEVLVAQGSAREAQLELDKVAGQAVDPSRLAPIQARVWVATGQFKQVLDSYRGQSLSDVGAQAAVQAAVAAAALHLGQRQVALTALAEALKANPTSVAARLVEARVAAADGKVDDALAVVDKALANEPANAEALILRGLLLRFGKADNEKAAAAFAKAAEDPSKAVDARGALIELRLQQGEVAGAREQVAALRKAFPTHVQTNFLDARVAYAEKDYGRTESLTDQILRVAPSLPPVLTLGGAASLQRGDLIAAETKLGKVVQTVEGAAVARRLLAQTYARMGQPEKALGVLAPLTGGGHVDPEALTLAGQIHLQSGDVRTAEVLFQRASQSKPDDVGIRATLALVDLARGNADAAFSALRALSLQDPGVTADLALISAQLRRQEFDGVLKAVEGLEKKQPGTPGASYMRGLALRGKGDVDGARTAFEEAVSRDVGHFGSIAALAALDVDAGHLDSARRRLDAEVQRNPKSVAARMAVLDVATRQQAKPEQLLELIEDAIKAAPTEPAPRVAKITQLSLMGDSKAAALAAQNALAVLPQQPLVLDAAGRAFANSGEDQQAISAFNKLVAALPGSPTPYLRLADLHAKRGNPSAVTSNLSRAFEVAPESQEVHGRLLAHASRTKDFRSVIAAAKQLQRNDPTSALGYLLEGDAEAVRRAWPAATAAFRAALTKQGGAERAPRLLYAALRASGDRAGASRFVADWLREHPADVALLDHVGGEALMAKDYPTAEQYFRQVLVIRPGHVVALNNLAWLLAEQGRAGAVEMAERALTQTSQTAPILDTLAKALAAEGQMERALEVQKKAVEGDANRPQYRLNLARMQIKAGQKAQARAELEALAKLGERLPFQAEVATLLQAVR